MISSKGFVIPVIVQTPSILCSPPISKKLITVTVMALLDTGASRTYISNLIAEDLELEPSGFSVSYTAAGSARFPDYAVDILFPDQGLHGFENLRVGSCKLPYKRDVPNNYASNFGILIGRDMMARWNITWNGPTSSVFISQ
jgi:hypothetical protein